MPEFCAEDLAEWSGGEWSEFPKQPVRSVSHDTRDLKSGALYVALAGERVDGHDLIPLAREAGAAAALCRRGRALEGFPCLEVKETGKALENLAKGYRSSLQPAQMIGITGSAGKTTVKDFTAAMLRAADSICSTRGNWNNFIGLPLSLLSMESGHRFGVFELGMNHAGEISALADILKPTCGLITSIGEAHLENLGSVEAIAEEKSSLLSSLPADGFAVLDQDSPWFEFMKARCGCRSLTVSLENDADYRGIQKGSVLEIIDRQRKETFVLRIPLPGLHMLGNLLQAAAMARECGCSPDAIAGGIQTYEPAPMRWQRLELGGYAFINDAYNANPLSMRKSVRTFSELEHAGPKWLVLGGMSELGAEEKSLHVETGTEVDAGEFEGVLLVGEKGGWIGEGISRSPVWKVGNAAEAAALIRARASGGTLFLLKASRSERLEKVLEELQKSKEKTV
ncbi:MAG: UDP-N-acetylmuramoyl-tripeptide--D-alanyl-D-alanine ligase [Kiritimatiellia bacterium]